jgi:hypothetical protein
MEVPGRSPDDTVSLRTTLGLVPPLHVDWFLDTREIDRCVDQTDMTKRLRKISEHATGTRVVSLGEQTEIIPQRKQTLEKPARFIETPLQDVIVRKPKTASEKCALAWRQTVNARCSVVAHHQAAIAYKPLLDRRQRAPHARIACRKKTNKRNLKKGSVKMARSEGLDKAAEFRVEAAAANFAMDLVGNLLPVGGRARVAGRFCR